MINITDRLNVSPVHCPIAPAVASPHAPAQPRQHQRALVDVTRKAGFPHLNSKYLYSLWAITNPYDCQRIYHQFRKTSVKIHKKKNYKLLFTSTCPDVCVIKVFMLNFTHTLLCHQASSNRIDMKIGMLS